MFLTLLGRLKYAWGILPGWAQAAVNDLVAAAVIAVAALNLGIPGTLGQAKAEAFLAVLAVVGVLEPWVRRHVSEALGWFWEQWAKA